MVAGLLIAFALTLLFGAVAYYAVRRENLDGPLLHVTTVDGVSGIIDGVPDGWVHIRPGRRLIHRVPLLGWPLGPFRERVYFYLGDTWPGRFRRRYNLPEAGEFTYAVVVAVEDLATHGGQGHLYRRWIDGSAAWSAEYRGPGRIIQRTP